ncbi:phosphonopyruvate decarboxylase [Candidatus Parcubacteria bacterium]|nr:MAG: phosphonopyruvate decarboxylase [Candidatus Parcubacteria bacterium]
MLHPRELYELFVANGIRFFTGVPDSLLKDFCAYLEEYAPPENHIIAANEGNAVALAAGHHLATGEAGCVYMQNSGLGNAINPLVSLVDREVYGIPALLLIGWRGEPGMPDEPQHRRQGAITREILQTLSIPYAVLGDSPGEASAAVKLAVETMEKEQAPYAIVVKKGMFSHHPPRQREAKETLRREEAIQIVLAALEPKDIVVATTGKASREIFEHRERGSEGHDRDFLSVGSMGHASSLALAVALRKPERNVWCIDGDGAMIMHMGACAVIAERKPKNLRHILINNGAHESVGGQPTAGFSVDFCSIARGCGYPGVFAAQNKEQLEKRLSEMHKSKEGPLFLEIRVRQGSRADLGRPTRSPKENREGFMKFLADSAA